MVAVCAAAALVISTAAPNRAHADDGLDALGGIAGLVMAATFVAGGGTMLFNAVSLDGGRVPEGVRNVGLGLGIANLAFSAVGYTLFATVMTPEDPRELGYVGSSVVAVVGLLGVVFASLVETWSEEPSAEAGLRLFSPEALLDARF